MSKALQTQIDEEILNEEQLRLQRLQERSQIICNKLIYDRTINAAGREFLVAEMCQIDEQIEQLKIQLKIPC